VSGLRVTAQRATRLFGLLFPLLFPLLVLVLVFDDGSADRAGTARRPAGNDVAVRTLL
jgi:hypothetical protein